jgi:hypothetical protein
MGRRTRKPAWRIAHALVLATSSCALAGPAGAQEYCVACSEPNVIYRCVIEGAQPGGGQPLQMLCITTLAKQGGHATCGVKRGTVFECDGAVKRIPWVALNAPQQPDPAPALPWAAQPASKPEPAAAPVPPAAAPPPAPPAPDAPPQTVLELAKRANEDTAKQMKKAGETVKDATIKTWDCVSSLFTRCW